MPTSTNVAVFNGTLVRDPEPIANNAGVEFSLAVNESFKKKDSDEWEEYTNYLDCVTWGKGAPPILKHLEKGSRVTVTARIKQERWEKDGQKRSRVRFHTINVEFGPKKAAGSSGAASSAADVDDDEDIPF